MTNHTLFPTQQHAFDTLLRVLPLGHVFVLTGYPGSGKTSLLHNLHRQLGGKFLNMKHFIDAMYEHHPLALEEVFERMVQDALNSDDIVIVDDLHLINNVVCCNPQYQRLRFLNAHLLTLCTYAIEAQKTLIFGTDGFAPDPVQQRAFTAVISSFVAEDYEFLSQVYLGPTLAQTLDYKKIHRFASKLNAHQLKSIGTIRNYTDRIIRSHLVSNVRRGTSGRSSRSQRLDDVIQSLEARRWRTMNCMNST